MRKERRQFREGRLSFSGSKTHPLLITRQIVGVLRMSSRGFAAVHLVKSLVC